jgi:hypothetical protein
MALPIKSPPVLYGKAAREFEEKRKNMTESLTKEEVQEIARKWKPFLKKYYNPFKND